MIEPHSESDPAAILFQFLAAFGNVVGRRPHRQVEAARHTANVYVVLVGSTSKGRKGTAWGRVLQLFETVNESWIENAVVDGLGSGEGLIAAVRDPREKKEAVRVDGKVVDYQSVIEDHGVSDKRRIVAATEFSSVLRVATREGNTLSAVLRNAWDTGDLRILIKNNPMIASDAHISVVGHITRQELLSQLKDVEAANGFGNRFLWVWCRRSKELPNGGSIDESLFRETTARIRDAVDAARETGALDWTPDASRRWCECYSALSAERPGLLGAILARSEAQVVRLALIYALLDRSQVIGIEHLEAAFAVWKYAESSARYIFGDKLGNAAADKILAALRGRPEGMTRTEINALFQNHRAGDVREALRILVESNLVEAKDVPTGGRPAQRWFALGTPAIEATKAIEGRDLSSLPSLSSQARAMQPAVELANGEYESTRSGAERPAEHDGVLSCERLREEADERAAIQAADGCLKATSDAFEGGPW